MLVANTIGYDFSFKYDGKQGKGVITIPFDYKPYKIPDDVDITQFKELKEVVVVDKSGEIQKEELKQPISDTTNYSDDIKNFPKTSLEKKDDKPPLKGVKIKKNKRKAVKKKVK